MKPEIRNAKLITSRDNPLLKLARSARDGEEQELIFIEGLRLCEEALRSGLEIAAVIYSEEIALKERARTFLESAATVADRLASVSEKLLATVSYTKTPQGLIALAQRPDSSSERLQKSLQIKAEENALLVVMHGINNPVNVGAILRSAEAAGVTGVIATAHTTDPYSPKSLRGAMGSAFRLPIWFGSSFSGALAWCNERRIETVCADAKAETTYTEVDWTRPRALIVGPESTGLTAAEVASAKGAIRIPMQGEVESLNVGVATAIVLYEAARQRIQRL